MLMLLHHSRVASAASLECARGAAARSAVSSTPNSASAATRYPLQRRAPANAWSASSRFGVVQVAHFSSSPSPRNGNHDQQPVSLLSGFDELQQTIKRCRDRKHVFDHYASSKVFQPSPLALVNNWFLFYHLNRPQKTYEDLDMVEFLEGAKQALESTMMAMYSREFANFAAGAIHESELADQLNTVLEPVSLDALKEFIKYTEASGIRTELMELDVHAAYLVGAIYDRVPRRPNTNKSGAEVVGVAMDERLRIQVCFEITEHVNIKLPEDLEPELMKKDNVAIWQFESIVSSVDAIDWRIEPLNMVSG